LKVSRLWEVVANVIGILLGKPDGIIRRYFHSHNAGKPTRWLHLLKLMGVRIKKGQVILVHFAKPDASLVVNGWSHQPTVSLGKRILSEFSYSHDSRSYRCLSRRSW